MKNLADIIRLAGLHPIEPGSYMQSTTKRATAAMRGRTHYYEPDTLAYFYARVSSLYVTDNGTVMVALERLACDYNNSKRGYRTTVHDLTGFCLDSAAYGVRENYGIKRRSTDNLIISKPAAMREFREIIAAVNAHERDILAAAMRRLVREHACALESLKTAQKAIRK
jgi:hypothetical protein